MNIPLDQLAAVGLADLAERALVGERLSVTDGARLLECPNLPALGWLAHQARLRMNGRRAYYTVNVHLNHTNVCANRCRFCAFSRTEGEPGAYTLGIEECVARVQAAGEVDEIHVVGGCHPTLPFSYYCDLLVALRAAAPRARLQAFTAVEIDHIAGIGGLKVEEALSRLQECGLEALPGGGAEVFAPRVRAALCPEKIPGSRWLEVMRAAHRLGIPGNATMLYGHLETPQEMAEHLAALRELQDETHGFLAFIPLAFHPEHTALSDLPGSGGVDALRVIATARLMLDNIPHVKAFWIMLGEKLAEVALSFGADDLDGTVGEEQITHAAGARTPAGLTEQQLLAMIHRAGWEPVRRDTLYQVRARP